MAEKIFSSYSTGKSNDAPKDQHLFIETGTEHLACIVRSGDRRLVVDVELFQFKSNERHNPVEHLREIALHSVLMNKSYNSTTVNIHTSTSLFVPAAHAGEANLANNIDLVFGEAENVDIFAEPLPSKADIINVFRVSRKEANAIQQFFNIASFGHVYASFAENALEQADRNGLLKVYVYENHIVVVLVIDNKLHLIQTYTYQLPEDILYYLLSLLQRFPIHAASINLQFSGFIDAQSQLVTELKKYFKNLGVEDAGELDKVDLAGRPKHFLTPFLNAAR